MKLTFDSDNLPIEEQKALYLWLKAKFDPDSPSIFADAYCAKEALLNKSLKDLVFSAKVFNAFAAMRLNTVRDLCNCKRSDLMKLTNFGDRSCDEVENVLAEMGLTLKMENKGLVETMNCVGYYFNKL